MTVWVYLLIFIVMFLLSLAANKCKDVLYAKIWRRNTPLYRNTKEYLIWSAFTGLGTVIFVGVLVLYTGNPLIV